jgi:hypothetical protein
MGSGVTVLASRHYPLSRAAGDIDLRRFSKQTATSLIAEPPRDVPKVPQFEWRRWCRRPAHLKFSLLLSANSAKEIADLRADGTPM